MNEKIKKMRLIPVVVLCISCTCCFVMYFSSNNVFFERTWIGFVLLALNICIYFFNEKIAFRLTGLILLLGAIGLIAFTYVIISNAFYFRIGSLELSLEFQTFPFMLFLLWAGIFLYEYREENFKS